MGTFLQSHFHTMCISRTIDCSDECQLYKWNIPEGNILWTGNIYTAYDFVLRAGGESLRTIIIGDGMYNGEGIGIEMVGDFLRACPNVRSLSVSEPYGAWACAFARQLEKLEVVGNTPGASFPKYCPSLRELSCNCRYIYEGSDTPQNVKGVDWKRIGRHLERLTLCGVSVSQHELGKMRHHCSKLKYLVIILRGENNGDVAEFIGSYGDQLDFICIDDKMKGELKVVVENCSKARFHVHFTMGQTMLPTLSVLGPRLEKATLDLSAFAIDTSEWAYHWKICISLKVLTVAHLRVEHIRAIMSTPKYHLKEIRISNGDDSNTKEIMNIIAKGTTNVEIFHYHFNEFGPSLSNLDKFIDKNKSTLRSFRVTNQNRTRFPESDTGKMIRKLLDCPLLQEICVPQVPAASLLDTIRKRGIYFRQPTRIESEFRIMRYEN